MNAATTPVIMSINDSPVLSDALPKGARVRLTGLFGMGPREGTVKGGKGIIRCIAMDATNGHYAEMGDTYIDEIRNVFDPATSRWMMFRLTPAHAKKLSAIRAFLN